MQISGNAAILKADRSLVGRMIVIAQSRQLNMRAMCVHPLDPMPWALATSEGLKTNKAVLAHHFQKGAALAECIPDKSGQIHGTYWIDCRCYSLHGAQRKITQFTN